MLFDSKPTVLVLQGLRGATGDLGLGDTQVLVPRITHNPHLNPKFMSFLIYKRKLINSLVGCCED